MKLHQRQALAGLQGPQGDAQIQASMGYAPADLITLIRMARNLEHGQLGEREVAALQRMHPAVPIYEIERRVREVNAAPAGRGRMEAFIGHVTLGGPDAVQQSMALIDNFSLHEQTTAIEGRLDERQAHLDQQAGRKPTSTGNERPQGDGVRADLAQALFDAGALADPPAHVVAGRLADRIEGASARLHADREGGGEERSLRDIVSDSVDMHDAHATGQELGLIGEGETLHSWSE